VRGQELLQRQGRLRSYWKVVVLFSLLGLAAHAFGADYQIEANIRYSLHPETVLDIVQARAPALKNRPGAIVIHGGGWIQGNKESILERFCLPFVEHGFVVANVEYRLAPSATAPAAVNDVLEAAKWFRDRAADYKLDPNQIIVTGNSAGGHLAMMVGMAPESAGLGPWIKIAAIINFYGISDVPDQLQGPHLQTYAMTWLPEQPDRMELAKKLSPIAYVRKGLPPVLSIHGDADPVVPYEQSLRLTKELKAAGDQAELITVPGGQHGFPPGEMSQLWPQVFKWLKKHKISS
jgi:acetyl esterase/lipase